MKTITDATILVGQYNWIPYNYLATGAASVLCGFWDGAICNLIMSGFADEDPSIDYTERYDMYMSNCPSGAGYKDFIHYGQNIAAKEMSFKRYDMGSAKANKAKYGQSSPPDYDLKLLNFPLAVFSGSKDLLADPKDVAWTVDQMKDTIIFDHEYYLGHMSFAIAKDMSFFTVDTMAILNHYNGICD